ncbi:MAG: OmpA family protein [Pseudomonadota bacterium]|nr:OmpA family protein [Pseudomonadota bacterium]
MTLRALTLATSAALLTLSGCATQQTGGDPADAANRRLGAIETRLQAEASSSQGMIDALGRKVGTLSDELRQMREAMAGQASGVASQQASGQALAARMDKTEQRLGELAGAQAALPELRAQAHELGQRLDRLGALANYRIMDTTLAHEADSATFSEVQEAAEMQQEEMAEQISEALAQSGEVHAALPALAERTREIEQRLERLDTQAAEAQDDSAALAERLEAGESQMEEMAEQISEALAQSNDARMALPALTEKTDSAEKRLDELAAQTRQALDQATAVQAALPTLSAKVAEAGPRMNDYDARLAELSKRLEEVARMAQDAYDATGLGQRKIYGKVVESITLTEDKTLFPINSPSLGEQDKAKLDALVIRLKALGTAYHLQIQGHTEGFGSDDYNYELGKARAEAVKNYLKEKGGIPLLRMSVMSYGSIESPGYANKGNRRVVVQVMQ